MLVKGELKADVSDEGIGVSPPDPLSVGTRRLIQHLLDERHFVEVALHHSTSSLSRWKELSVQGSVNCVECYGAHTCCIYAGDCRTLRDFHNCLIRQRKG